VPLANGRHTCPARRRPSQRSLRRCNCTYKLTVRDDRDRLTPLGPLDRILPGSRLRTGSMQLVRGQARLITHTTKNTTRHQKSPKPLDCLCPLAVPAPHRQSLRHGLTCLHDPGARQPAGRTAQPAWDGLGQACHHPRVRLGAASKRSPPQMRPEPATSTTPRAACSFRQTTAAAQTAAPNSARRPRTFLPSTHSMSVDSLSAPLSWPGRPGPIAERSFSRAQLRTTRFSCDRRSSEAGGFRPGQRGGTGRGG
jgi:hypothetical protein